MKYDYANEILESIMDGTMAMRNEIVMIPAEKIYPHPQNPRRDLGDLEELADSILAQGVLQNLTVVPWQRVFENDDPPCEGAVVTVIGHRRRAAAEKAGVRELPCIIVDMDRQEQVATMLLENMQRSDLTVYEQAQGMQMMMDLGSTVEEISELTGFAPRTVQRRLQIAKLPAEAFTESKMQNMRLEDYIKISQLESEKDRKSAIMYAGTSSFDWQIRSMLHQQQVREDMKTIRVLLDAAGYKKYSGKGNPVYSGDYDDVWSARTEDIIKAGQLPVTTKKVKNGQWYLSDDRLYLVDDAPKKKAEKLSPKRVDADRKRAELKTLCKRAYESRHEWILAYKPKREHEKIINRWYLEMSLREISQSRGSYAYTLLYEKTGGDVVSKWYRPYDHELIRAVDENGALAFITWVLTGDDDYDYNLPYEEHWQETPPEWSEEKAKTWKRAYAFLEAIGYPVSDEERALLDGTHELYGGKNE